MLHSRHEILGTFRLPEYVPHPRFPGMDTFAFLAGWPSSPLTFSLPLLAVEITNVDYLRRGAEAPAPTQPLRFQQDGYRMWYQIEGTGVLQNLTRSVFGRASPGLLGLMDSGHRFSYLHQRGTFECFLVDFRLKPGRQAHCFWNSAIEGKTVLDEDARVRFEHSIFTLMRLIGNDEDHWGMRIAALAGDILAAVFDGKLLTIADEHFPADKAHSLVAMARAHMDSHYASLHHQSGLRRVCGVDINYLNILFKRETGMTLYKYLTGVRMEHAKHLLDDRRLSVADIASRVGYPNSNSFSRAFRRHAGTSPTEYTETHSPVLPRRTGDTAVTQNAS